MRRHAVVPGILALVALCGAVCAAPPPAHEKGGAPAMDSPLEIRTSLDRGPTLKASLRNRSSATQWVLHDLRLQPSELALIDANGGVVPSRDARDAMKFDNTVRRDSYKPLAPGASLDLFQAKAVKKDGRYQMEWGPYRFSGLAPGPYRARVRWTSAHRDVVEEDGSVREMNGVWLGTVTSAEFTVRLP